MRTIKQQIATIDRVINIYGSDIYKHTIESLREVKTTLLAIEVIGKNKIELLPELLTALTNHRTLYDLPREVKDVLERMGVVRTRSKTQVKRVGVTEVEDSRSKLIIRYDGHMERGMLQLVTEDLKKLRYPSLSCLKRKYKVIEENFWGNYSYSIFFLKPLPKIK